MILSISDYKGVDQTEWRLRLVRAFVVPNTLKILLNNHYRLTLTYFIGTSFVMHLYNGKNLQSWSFNKCWSLRLFVWFDILHPSPQFFSYVGTGLTGLNQFKARINVSCSWTQRSDAGEAWVLKSFHLPSMLLNFSSHKDDNYKKRPMVKVDILLFVQGCSNWTVINIFTHNSSQNSHVKSDVNFNMEHQPEHDYLVEVKWSK